MEVSASVAVTITGLLFVVLAALVGWSIWQKMAHGTVAQNVWSSPEYLRFNQPGDMAPMPGWPQDGGMQ